MGGYVDLEGAEYEALYAKYLERDPAELLGDVEGKVVLALCEGIPKSCRTCEGVGGTTCDRARCVGFNAQERDRERGCGRVLRLRSL